MEIKKDYGFTDLKNECWSGAIDTLKVIEDNGKEEELMELLEMSFDYMPTMTEVNDFLWFEDDIIFNEFEIEEGGK